LGNRLGTRAGISWETGNRTDIPGRRRVGILSVVATARNAERYTAPEIYWVDLR